MKKRGVSVLGERVAYYRGTRGLKQEDLARLAGICRTRLSEIENSPTETVDRRTCRNLEEHLNVPRGLLEGDVEDAVSSWVFHEVLSWLGPQEVETLRNARFKDMPLLDKEHGPKFAISTTIVNATTMDMNGDSGDAARLGGALLGWGSGSIRQPDSWVKSSLGPKAFASMAARICSFYDNAGESSECVELAEWALSQIDSSTYESRWLRYQKSIGLKNNRKPEDAMRILFQLESELEKGAAVDDPLRIAVQHHIGKCFWSSGEYRPAEMRFKQCIELRERNHVRSSYDFRSLGQIYLATQRESMARDHYKKALSIATTHSFRRYAEIIRHEAGRLLD